MIWLDFKLALRMLARYPLLTIVASAGMAFGIAAGVGGFEMRTQFVDPKLPLNTVADLTDYLKNGKGKNSYGSAANPGTISAEMYLARINQRPERVNYRDAKQAQTELQKVDQAANAREDMKANADMIGKQGEAVKDASTARLNDARANEADAGAFERVANAIRPPEPKPIEEPTPALSVTCPDQRVPAGRRSAGPKPSAVPGRRDVTASREEGASSART